MQWRDPLGAALFLTLATVAATSLLWTPATRPASSPLQPSARPVPAARAERTVHLAPPSTPAATEEAPRTAPEARPEKRPAEDDRTRAPTPEVASAPRPSVQVSPQVPPGAKARRGDRGERGRDRGRGEGTPRSGAHRRGGGRGEGRASAGDDPPRGPGGSR